MNEKSYWLGFSSFSGIGPGKFGLLLKEFGTTEKAWKASFEALEKVLGKALTPQFVDFREEFSIAEYEKKLKKARVSFLILTDEDYPHLLKQIKKPPFVLYYKGNRELLAGPSTSLRQNYIAIVGTRRITEYGKQVTSDLTQNLAAAGFCVVSGLALGVDAAAHRVCIESGGKTIAVLGCGVDCCYPRENQRLYEEILDSGGAIVSEYPLGEPPSKGSFPSRNRIIAGLSQAVIVTEWSADSGALYTADEAFALGRPVFAVPGPITSSLSKGPHSLIGKGGKLISGAEEILAEMRVEPFDFAQGKRGEMRNKQNPTSPRLRGTREEQKVIDLLQNESLHFDEIVKRSKINSSKLGSILSLMEMKGMVKGLGSGNFCLA